MCGINFITRPADNAAIGRMNDLLVHRGPDGGGIHQNEHIALGSRRLRIIDIDERSDMPLHSACGRYHMVYNGEIYNFRELRRELEEGYSFRGESDSEVLFALLQREGLGAVTRLNGMFAFAFWDERERKLWLGRDRLGIKPLFYAFWQERILGSSELGPLLSFDYLKESLDEKAAYHYMSLLSVPEPFTFYERIRRFPAGHVGEVVGDGGMRLWPYWSLSFVKIRGSGGELAEQVRNKFGEAVRRQLVADVPLGVLLSGGIDSNVLLSHMARQSSSPVKSFAMGFEGGEDESDAARRSAELLNCEHVSHQLAADHLWREIPQILRAFGEPFAGGLPMWFLCREVSKQVKVALCGSGGDEMFGNYGRIRQLRTKLGWGSALRSGMRLYGAMAFMEPMSPRMRYLLRHGAPLGHLHHDKTYPVPEWRKRSLLLRPPEIRSDMWLDELFWQGEGEELEDRLMRVEMMTQLKNEFLYSQDILSMAHHLEVRVPFLDHEFVELMASIPTTVRSRSEDPKVWMRQVFSQDIPAHIVEAPKRGFMIPYGAWMRGELRSRVDHLLEKDFLVEQGLFEAGRVRELWNEHQAGAEHSYALWSLAVYQIWFRQHHGLELPW